MILSDRTMIYPSLQFDWMIISLMTQSDWTMMFLCLLFDWKIISLKIQPDWTMLFLSLKFDWLIISVVRVKPDLKDFYEIFSEPFSLINYLI